MNITIQIERTKDDPPEDLLAQTISTSLKPDAIWTERSEFIRQNVEPLIADLLYRLRNAWTTSDPALRRSI